MIQLPLTELQQNLQTLPHVELDEGLSGCEGVSEQVVLENNGGVTLHHYFLPLVRIHVLGFFQALLNILAANLKLVVVDKTPCNVGEERTGLWEQDALLEL